ncbi:MAG: hypothetical protein EKK60_05155, partial [Gordonia sp. (in: high G+C Gram-positive bacteria)]
MWRRRLGRDWARKSREWALPRRRVGPPTPPSGPGNPASGSSHAAEWVVSQCSAIVCGVTEEDVRAAYSRRAVEYIDLFGNIESASDVDRTRLVEWVGGLSGRIIDVGCGPGQWTRF